MKHILFIVLLCLANFVTLAQVVSDRTNRIRLDTSSEEVTTSLPQIIWEFPRLEYTNSTEERVNIKCKIISSIPLTRVEIRLKKSFEGEPFVVREEYVEEGAVEVLIDKTIPFNNGQNFVEILATNEQGGTVTDFRSILVGMDAISNAVAIDRKDYAILFATDRYENWSDLVNPVFDANTIAKELETKYGFEVKIVQDADQDKVFTTLREYAQMNFKPQDQLFIFFAGHGQYDEVFGEGYVVASNTLINDPSKNTYISHNRLRNNINNIPCEHIFLTMDVCFGGTFDERLASSRGTAYEELDNNEFIVRKLSTRTRKYLTSGGKEYVSDGVRGQHSPFARKFLEALASNGGEDRILTLAELNVFMQRLTTTPTFGGFGTNENGSEFLFIAK